MATESKTAPERVRICKPAPAFSTTALMPDGSFKTLSLKVRAATAPRRARRARPDASGQIRDLNAETVGLLRQVPRAFLLPAGACALSTVATSAYWRARAAQDFTFV
jgi:hypothetical protein